MKCLIVHQTDKGWYGEEVAYKRSGSGFHRETTNIAIPQAKPEIVAFAKANDYAIEWRNITVNPPGVVSSAGSASA